MIYLLFLILIFVTGYFFYLLGYSTGIEELIDAMRDHKDWSVGQLIEILDKKEDSQ